MKKRFICLNVCNVHVNPVYATKICAYKNKHFVNSPRTKSRVAASYKINHYLALSNLNRRRRLGRKYVNSNFFRNRDTIFIGKFSLINQSKIDNKRVEVSKMTTILNNWNTNHKMDDTICLFWTFDNDLSFQFLCSMIEENLTFKWLGRHASFI